MHTNFSMIDRNMAKKVYDRFGGALLTIAERFLRSRYVTKVSLTCDALTMVQNGNVASSGSVSAAPTLITVGPPVISTPTPVVTPVVPVQEKVELPSLPPAAVTVQPVPSPAPVAPPPAVNGSGKLMRNGRTDSIGNLGEDPNALTSVDAQAVPTGFPRRIDSPPVTIRFDSVPQMGSDGLMPPDVFRREFEKKWLRR
jgi:hypothetical protein